MAEGSGKVVMIPVEEGHNPLTDMINEEDQASPDTKQPDPSQNAKSPDSP